MTEALVYIGAVFVILGCGYTAMYRYIDNSVAMRRSADDVSTALHVGERWRADLRTSRSQSWSDDASGGRVLLLTGGQRTVAYRFAADTVFRRRDAGAWAGLLTNVKSSVMEPDRRQDVTAWRWELELQQRRKGSVRPGSIRPLFTFIAVPEPTSTK